MIRTEHHDGDGFWASAKDDLYYATRPLLDKKAAQEAYLDYVYYWHKSAPEGRRYRLAVYKTHRNGGLKLVDAIAVEAF
jgi:hypothetical protein